MPSWAILLIAALTVLIAVESALNSRNNRRLMEAAKRGREHRAQQRRREQEQFIADMEHWASGVPEDDDIEQYFK